MLRIIARSEVRRRQIVAKGSKKVGELTVVLFMMDLLLQDSSGDIGEVTLIDKTWPQDSPPLADSPVSIAMIGVVGFFLIVLIVLFLPKFVDYRDRKRRESSE